MSETLPKEPIQTFAATLVQAYLFERFGQYAMLVACNPFKNYADVRMRVENFFYGRLKAAELCVSLNHKGTHSLQAYVCS